MKIANPGTPNVAADDWIYPIFCRACVVGDDIGQISPNGLFEASLFEVPAGKRLVIRGGLTVGFFSAPQAAQILLFSAS